MANATQQQIDADMFDNIRSTPEVDEQVPARDPSTAFIKQVTHPPSAVANFSGLPTQDCRNQVVTRWVQFQAMDQSAYNLAGTAVTIPNEKIIGYAFLQTSGVRLPYICYVKYFNDAGVATWAQDVRNTKPLDVYDFKRFYADSTLYRPAYRSLTTYLNSTAFNDTGLTASSQFNPSILFGGAFYNLAEHNPKLFRLFVSEHVKRFGTCRRPKVIKGEDSYEVIDRECKPNPKWKDLPASVLLDLEKSIPDLKDDAPRMDPDVNLQIINFGLAGNTISGNVGAAEVPTASQIMNLSVRSYGGKAKDGTFNVQRLNTLSPDWLTTSNTNKNNSGGDFGLYECWVYYEDTAGDPHLKSYLELRDAGPGTPVTLRPCLDTFWSSHMTWCWTYYDGLSANLNFAGNPVTATNIITKSYIGAEVQPSARSAWAGLQRLGPAPDLTAMQALQEAFYVLKDGMPACYNFWGVLANIAKAGAQAIGGGAVKELLNAVTNSGKQQRKPKAAPKKVKKEKAEIKDADRQIHAINKKLDKIAISSRPSTRSRVQQQTARNKARKQTLDAANKLRPVRGTQPAPEWARRLAKRGVKVSKA